MRSSRLVMIFVILAAATTPARGAVNQISIASDGCTVNADGDQAVVSITCDNLGNLLEEVRLNLQSDHGLRPLKKWSVEKKGAHQLSIRTAQPQTVWLFDLGPETLKISSTSTAAVLTADVPAPSNRIPVRILDRQGFPVDWLGTDEVASGYGGAYTRNQSFLPARNPEVMYFELGQVASSNFHDLFDRRTDTVISFPERTLLQRNNHNPDLLDVTIPVPGNALVRLVPNYFTKILGVPFYVPFDDSYFRRAPVVWSSWTSYYGEVREEDIVRNADWIAANLKPYGFEYVELDDGYDCGNCEGFVGTDHRWIENWDREKFSHGPQWLAGYIKSKGLHAGLWLVPNAYAGAKEEHPDWYLRDKEGKLILDYATPALDSTNPQVLTFLKKLFTTLDDWGFEYYKFDGEHALPKYLPAVDRDRLYDQSIDPIIAYQNRLKLIRETLGPRRFVEGCPSGTPLNGIGYFNSYFNGGDVYNSWRGMYPLFSSINANAFLNHIVVYVMPGEGIDIGPPMTLGEAKQKRNPTFLEIARTREQPMMGFGTTLAEARTLVTYLSLTGVTYSVASVMPELPEERVKLLKHTLPSMPILPADLFSRGTVAKWDTFKDTQPDDYIHNYPEILDLKVNAKSGVYDVVGLTNWRSGTAEKEICFADKLGLGRGSRYIVFDFWGQKLLGVFKDCIKAEIGPHDTRALLIHPLLSRPQLIGNSRHITGAYSITDQEWDDAKNVLRGTSETIPGDIYTLWFHVPAGTTISEVKATTKKGNVILVQRELQGTFLKVSFQGQHDPVGWELHFANHLGR
jgi:hypothetical protein